jgi:hypothetical protein
LKIFEKKQSTSLQYKIKWGGGGVTNVIPDYKLNKAFKFLQLFRIVMVSFLFLNIPKLSLIQQQNIFLKKSSRLVLYYLYVGLKSSKKNKVIFRKTPYFWIFRRKGFYFTKRRMMKVNKYSLEKDMGLFDENMFKLKLKGPLWPVLNFFRHVFRKKNKNLKKILWRNFKKVRGIIWFRKKWAKGIIMKLWSYNLNFSVQASYHPNVVSYETYYANFKKPIKKKFVIKVEKDDDLFTHELHIQKLRLFYLKFYLYKIFTLMSHEYWTNYSYRSFLKTLSLFFKPTRRFLVNVNTVTKENNDLHTLFRKKFIINFNKAKHLRKTNKKASLKLKTEKLKTLYKEKKKFLRSFFEKFTPKSEELPPHLAFSSIYNNFNKNYSLNYIHLLIEDLHESMALFFCLAEDLGSSTKTASKTSLNFFKKNWVNSNYFIPIGIFENIKKLIFVKKKVFKKDFSHRYYQFYINNFLNKFVGVKTLCIIETNHTKFKNFFTNDFIIATSELIGYFSKWNKRFFKQFQVSHLIEYMLFSFLKKDLYFFTKFFQRSLENIFLKKHKKILYSMEFILKKFFTKIFFFTKILGFKFEISGKISVTGNSKARNKIIRHGFYSLTNKNLKIDYLYGVVRTSTGVLGFRSFITY